MSKKTEVLALRLGSETARELKKIARSHDGNKSEAVRRLIHGKTQPSPNRDYYVAELMKDACAFVTEELRKQIDELKSDSASPNKIARAVKKVLDDAGITSDVLRKAIDPNNAMEAYYLQNSYPNGFPATGGFPTPELAALAREISLAQMGVVTEPSTDNSESETTGQGWQPDSDSESLSPAMEKMLHSLGIETDQDRLAKHDAGPKDPNHVGFKLVGNDEFLKRDLRDAEIREKQERFLNGRGGDSFIKSAIDRSSRRRDATELDSLAKSIAGGNSGFDNSATDAIARMFDRNKLRKA